VPVLAPGELVTADVVDYLVSGVKSGMLIPDAADPQLETLKVVAG
jgi:arginine/lysine/ornithine decarboxylase